MSYVVDIQSPVASGSGLPSATSVMDDLLAISTLSGLYTSYEGDASVTLTSGKISTLRNRKTGGDNFVQSLADNRLTLVDDEILGRPVLAFDDSLYMEKVGTFAWASAWTIAVVTRSMTDTGVRQIVSDNSTLYAGVVRENTNMLVQWTPSDILPQISYAEDNWSVFIHGYNGGSPGAAYAQKNFGSIGAATVTLAGSAMRIGSNNSVISGPERVAMIAVFSGANLLVGNEANLAKLQAALRTTGVRV